MLLSTGCGGGDVVEAPAPPAGLCADIDAYVTACDGAPMYYPEGTSCQGNLDTCFPREEALLEQVWSCLIEDPAACRDHGRDGFFVDGWKCLNLYDAWNVTRPCIDALFPYLGTTQDDAGPTGGS